jgi:hypothetical protein
MKVLSATLLLLCTTPAFSGSMLVRQPTANNQPPKLVHAQSSRGETRCPGTRPAAPQPVAECVSQPNAPCSVNRLENIPATDNLP